MAKKAAKTTATVKKPASKGKAVKAAKPTKAAPKAAAKAVAKAPAKAVAKPTKTAPKESVKPTKAKPVTAATKPLSVPAAAPTTAAAKKSAVEKVSAIAEPVKLVKKLAAVLAPASEKSVATEAPDTVKTSAPIADGKKASKAATKTSTAKEPAKKSKASLRIVKGGAAAGMDESHWQDLFDRHRGDQPQVYDMKEVFESSRPLQHKVLGWGWVISNENDRLDVLFKDGRRILISNYNPNR